MIRRRVKHNPPQPSRLRDCSRTTAACILHAGRVGAFMDISTLPRWQTGCLLIASALLLAGCQSSPPKQGRVFEDSFVERVEDTSGKPTYTIFGPLPRGQSPEIKAERIMSAACPAGSPGLLYANAISGQLGGGRSGSDMNFWDAAFSCDYAIH